MPKPKKRVTQKTNPHARTVKKLAKRLEKIFASLPQEHLYALAWTNDQRHVWVEHRSESTIVGKCLGSRLSGTRDPIVHLKNSDVKEERLKHSLYWKLTNYYESLLGLTQSLFDYLEKAFEQTNTPFPFKEPADYFISALTLDANNHYRLFLQSEFDDKDFTTNDKILALTAKKLRFWANPLGTGNLNPQETQKLVKSAFFELAGKNIWLFVKNE
jgi:hypothetical protein